MFSTTINSILSKDDKTKICFKGVFARDQLPKINEYPSCLILNTHGKGKPGEHWLAIYFDSNKHSYFFDSYGKHPSFFGLTDYINENSRSWSYNSKRIQGNSNHCGYYSVLFLIFKVRNILNKFYSYFNSNYDLNDKKISKMIKKY